MKSFTLLLTILSALIITGCDKGTDNAAAPDAVDTTATESAEGTTMEEAGEAVENAMESASDTSN